MAKYVEIGGDLELVDLDIVADDVYAGRGVLETIQREGVMFSSQEQMSTRIMLSEDVVMYIRLVSIMTSESEPAIKRGMISYGKTYLYKHLYGNVKRMRDYEILLVVKNRFVRESAMRLIPSPVKFNDRESSGLRLVKSTYGSLLYLADEMHLDRIYAVELAMWIAFKKLFEEDNLFHEMLKDDVDFIENLRIYDTLKNKINSLCNDYEKCMP